MRKLMTLFLVAMSFLVLSSCGPKKYDFTIRVHSMEEEREVESGETLYYDYTGYKMQFSIDVYRDDEVILNTTLEEMFEPQGAFPLIRVSGSYKELYDDEKFTSIKKLPLERGWYSYSIVFNPGKVYDFDYISEHNYKDFSFNLYVDYAYYINGSRKNNES